MARFTLLVTPEDEKRKRPCRRRRANLRGIFKVKPIILSSCPSW